MASRHVQISRGTDSDTLSELSEVWLRLSVSPDLPMTADWNDTRPTFTSTSALHSRKQHTFMRGTYSRSSGGLQSAIYG